METLKQDGVTYDFEHFQEKREEAGGIYSIDGSLPENKIPSCSNDPSWVIPKKTGYAVDQGVRIHPNGQSKGDFCSGGKGGDHCWTEQYWVESEITYDDWKQTGYAIDCSKTKSCQTTTVALTSSCKTHSTHKDNSIQVGLVGKWEQLVSEATGLGVELSGGYSHTWGTGDSTTICTESQGHAQCGWEDQDCHQPWSAQRNIKMYGYIARVCNGKGNNVQQNTKNKNGKWVRGQMDFSFSMPINKLVGCSGLCGQSQYPDPTPQGGNGRTPFTTGK
ncbi:hypothetical protein BJ875DRAFT_467202 [Amylocarpus encephaloides]|uniref:Uncharacterized protein n=1 Tax=Amylocarpus encephaloides TaxID=45428 RepID=A0A9P7YEC6_9HELO|nr:hypothetical protein BJ875DRAFT_467202 [Amylocarpus encephaloides]